MLARAPTLEGFQAKKKSLFSRPSQVFFAKTICFFYRKKHSKKTIYVTTPAFPPPTACDVKQNVSMLQTVKFACFNVRSICNKVVPVVELLKDHDVDICCMSETWLKDHLDSVTHLFEEFGFSILHTPRPTRGGGTAVVFRNSLPITKQITDAFSTFEVTETLLRLMDKNEHVTIRISSVYRTCGGKNNLANQLNKFFEEFEHYLSIL